MEEKPRILIVDDEATNLDILVALFENDYIVAAATTGSEALALAARTPRPDLVLLDVMMPGMDGYEVCSRLKAAEATRDLPVMFVTARDEESSEERGLALGAVDYITKPIRPPIVRARVKNLLARQELRQKLDELQRQFTAMIVHDLRSPLMVIRGFTEMAMADEEGGNGSSRQELLGRVIENVDRARLLVDQMLDLSQLQAGKVRLKREDIDLTRLLVNVATDHRVLAGVKSIDLRESIEAGMRAQVDPAKLTEVLANLIGNALKYTPANGRITLTARIEDSGHVRVEVSDTGPGISEDVSGRLFAPWEHTPTSMRQTLKSYGLGLAICKMNVEAHGGEISVKSRPGAGTTFSFRIPPRA